MTCREHWCETRTAHEHGSLGSSGPCWWNPMFCKPDCPGRPRANELPDGLHRLLTDIGRKYEQAMRERGDHDLLEAVGRYLGLEPKPRTLYEWGFEHGATPERHVHADGCGHDGNGVDQEFYRGWQDGRRHRRETSVALCPHGVPMFECDEHGWPV